MVSFLSETGEPNIVEKATILPPQSMMGALDDSIRLMVISRSEYNGKYDTVVDRESAFEILSAEMEKEKAEEEAKKQAEIEKKEEEQRLKEEEKQRKAEEKAQKEAEREAEKLKREEEKAKKEAEREAEKARKNSLGYKVGKAAERTANSALSSMGRKIANEMFKNIFKGK